MTRTPVYEQTVSSGIRLFSTWCGLCSIDSNSLSSARSTKAAMVGTLPERKPLCFPRRKSGLRSGNVPTIAALVDRADDKLFESILPPT